GRQRQDERKLLRQRDRRGQPSRERLVDLGEPVRRRLPDDRDEVAADRKRRGRAHERLQSESAPTPRLARSSSFASAPGSGMCAIVSETSRASRLADEAVKDRLWICMSVRIVIEVTRIRPLTFPPVKAERAPPRLLRSASVSRASFQA